MDDCCRKIITARELALFRKREEALIAACGCFDLLHPGHLEYLSGSKALGGILFVGVNSDRSILRLKKKRPYFSVQQRMQMIAAFACVDYVFEFHEDTFSESLCILRPDILTMGCDKNVMDFPEKATVEQYHIRAVAVGSVKTYSSSSLRRMLEQVADQ